MTEPPATPSYDLLTCGETLLRLSPPGLQRLEQAVDRRSRQPKPVGKLGDPEPARPARQCFEDARGTIDRLDRSSAKNFTIRHCRIAFGDVD